MGVPNERYYYGDLRLWQHGLEHAEAPSRGQLLSFQGVDQLRALVIPASPNNDLEVGVRCFGAPNPASKTRAGFRAILRAMRAALEARSARGDPLVWVEDDTRSKAVSAYAAPTVTSAAHGLSTGDVVLIRRLGAGLFSLVTVTVTGANTFTVAAVAGTALHAIAAADEIHLVEGYWLGMVFAGLDRIEPAPDQDWWSDGIGYRFKGSGSSTYARTTATVGS